MNDRDKRISFGSKFSPQPHQTHALSDLSQSSPAFAYPVSMSTPSFGHLPSWFPQSQSREGAGPASAYTYPDAVNGRDRIKTESYPLFNNGAHISPRQHVDVKQAGSMSTIDTERIVKKESALSPPSVEDDELNEKDEVKRKGKKRRRVVVACDVCRRKKVKCEGLPNTTNTCDVSVNLCSLHPRVGISDLTTHFTYQNCQNFGYTCTFTVEPDRSRGRYEILQAQKDTILAALRIVAPDVADQFDRGELSASSLSGLKAERNQTSKNGIASGDDLTGDSKNSSRTHDTKSIEMANDEQEPAESNHDSKRDLGPMIPDLEEGRPRYFGGSSNLTSFHHLDSRPSSPKSNQRYKLLSNSDGPLSCGTSNGTFQPPPFKTNLNDTRSRLVVLPRPRPQYPSNSVGWVRHVRKKTLVAVGRDDIYATEGWFNRHPLPETHLLHQLLDFFFRQLNPLLPIIHEHSLRKDLSQGRAEKDSAFRGLIFTIIAISSRFFRDDHRVREDPNDPDTAGDQYAAASRFHHQVYAASIINVQVLLLATAFMPSTLSSGPSFVVLGAAIRASQDIGLHTEKAYAEYNPLEQEMRRRAFWAAFILDSIISINMGRPTALRLEDVSVKFPLLASEEALTRAEAGGPIEEVTSYDTGPCPAAGFIHLIKLNIIAQDVVHTLYTPHRRFNTASPSSSGIAVGISQQWSPPSPSYKDMMVLCKRLDEWVAEIPSHLQDIRSSPFKLQAGLLQCGRHDIRLYILKPFLQEQKANPSGQNDTRQKSIAPMPHDGSILRKMLLPQCANHARECIRLLSTLREEGQLSHMVFVMQQAFLSAATFMLTVWHGTRDVETLCKDRDLIETTLSMLRPEENKFCSALLRRAQRILCNIAQRALIGIQDDEQRQRVQHLIDLHELMPLDGNSRLFSTTAPMPEGGTSSRTSFNDSRNGRNGVKELSASSAYNNVSYEKLASFNGINGEAANNYPALAAELPSSSINMYSKVSTPTNYSNNGAISNDLNYIDQWMPMDTSYTSALQIEPGDNMPASLEFTSDLAWTDYFSRFLGGLPSPLAANSSMSPVVHQTP